MTTTALQGINGVLEYVAGHTGLRFSMESANIKKASREDAYNLRAVTDRVRLRGKTPSSLILEDLQLVISSKTTILDWMADKSTLDVTDLAVTSLIANADGIASVTCQFLGTIPVVGGEFSVNRLFMFRDGMIHYVS